MDRRDMLKAAGGAVISTALLANQAFAGEEHHFHKHVDIPNVNEDLVAEALKCSQTGEACLKACFDVLSMGDTSMAACAHSVRELILSCNALAGMATHNSSHLKEYAAITAKICAECEQQCLKHKEHSQCADCAKACKGCVEVCKKYAA